jgi:hypothetical protein
MMYMPFGLSASALALALTGEDPSTSYNAFSCAASAKGMASNTTPERYRKNLRFIGISPLRSHWRFTNAVSTRKLNLHLDTKFFVFSIGVESTAIYIMLSA